MPLPPGTPRPYMRGDHNPASVLTWEKVRAIRQERAASTQNGVRVTYQKLADTYDVSVSTIKNIVMNLQWVDHAYTPPAPGPVPARHDPRPDMRGEDHPSAVLTWSLVRVIREAYAQNDTTYRELGAKYGVSLTAIRDVVRNTKWTDPDYTPPPKRPHNRSR